MADISNPISAAVTPGAIAEKTGEEGDDLPSINTEVKDQRSRLSKAPSQAQLSLATSNSLQTQNMLRNLDYKSVLHLIKEVEEQILAYSETFTRMLALGKQDRQLDGELKEVLRLAEHDRKLKKYYEQKERDREDREAKHAALLEKMARKQAVERVPGKIKMVRMNVPDHEKVVQAKKKVKTDWDMVRYFGDDVDWSEVPDGPTPEELQKIEMEKQRKLQEERRLQQNGDSDLDF